MNSSNPDKISRTTRIGSMFLDHLIMSFAVVIFFIPQMIVMMATAFSVEPGKESDAGVGPMMYVSIIGIAVLFLKDSIHGIQRKRFRNNYYWPVQTKYG